jgi:hypothetical protein
VASMPCRFVCDSEGKRTCMSGNMVHTLGVHSACAARSEHGWERGLRTAWAVASHWARGTVPKGVRWRGYDWRLASYASVGSGAHGGALGARARQGGVGFLQTLAHGAERDKGRWWLDADWGCKVAGVVRGERERS